MSQGSRGTLSRGVWAAARPHTCRGTRLFLSEGSPGAPGVPPPLTQGPEVPPLLHDGVEEAEAEHQLVPHGGLGTALEEHGVRDGVVEVGA